MLAKSIKNGFISGIKCSWFLIKVIIPVYFFITILKHTPVLDWLATVFAPAMGVFNMSGEAAIPIISAIALDDYGVIAAIKAIGISGYSVTMIAVMTMISHAIIIEAAILRKMGLSATFFVSYRLIGSVIAGFFLNILGVALGLW